MQIATGISADDWKRLDLQKPEFWETATSIFERRTRGRFIAAVDLLIADDEPKPFTARHCGFAILALDCLVIETLQAFRLGLTDTRGKTRCLSVQFLTERPAFKPFFTSTQIAERFYREFRCGIAHNAQIFGDGRVWSVGQMLQIDDGRMTLNRTEFHQALVTEFVSYVTELRNGSDEQLRTNFKTKMDFIADGRFSD